MSTAAADLESDDWELVNDDGFVYKRKRRRLDPSAIARPADPPPDPELEARRRRERKRVALLKVRHKYQKEIALWEHLSNTLSAMERSTKEKQDERDAGETLLQDNCGTVNGGFQGVSLLDELLSQAEGQEAIIHHITSLCDVAEAICDAEEENVKKSLLDLPVWGSPHELMTSLCED
ncbi:hypothetical protein V2J09_004063 [Rumex salicifolius]